MTICTTIEGDQTSFAVIGDLAGPEVLSLLRAVRHAGATDLTIDLQAAGRVDAAGVAAIRATIRMQRAGGHRSKVVGATHHVRWLLDLAGATDAAGHSPARAAAA